MAESVRQPALAAPRRSASFELLLLALPIIGMMVSRMLMGFIDVVMVARLGTDALAAISPAAMFVFLLSCLGMGLANGIQTFVAQADGRGEHRQAGAYAWQCFYIAGVFGLLTIPFAATVQTWFEPIARVGQHTEEVMALEAAYMRIALWSVAPSIVCMGLNAFFMGVQKPWITFGAVVLSLVANVFGNWVLIFGNLGFPALGIQGAAYATVFSWSLRALVLLGALLLPRFDRRYRTRGGTAFDWQKMKGLIRVGGPTSVQWIFDIGSWTLFMVLIVPQFGTVAMAAGNVALQLMHLSFMPAIGIGITLCSQVGFAIGRGEPDQAHARSAVAFRLNGIYMGCVGVLFVLAPRALMGWFTEGELVVEVGRLILLWVAIFQVFDAMAITYMSALRGAGDTFWPAVMMTLSCWVVFIGGGYMLARHVPAWYINGPWAMCTLYIIIVGLLMMWRWYGGHWRSIRLFDDQHPAPLAVETPDEAPAGTGTASMEPELEAVGGRREATERRSDGAT
jgi:MATE family multidrug resistance protein